MGGLFGKDVLCLKFFGNPVQEFLMKILYLNFNKMYTVKSHREEPQVTIFRGQAGKGFINYGHLTGYFAQTVGMGRGNLIN